MAKFEKLNGVSSEAVKKATGKTWDEWIDIIDQEEGSKLSHKEIAVIVFEKYLKGASIDGNPGWWSQMVTVGYEYAKNRRTKGETLDSGFEIGVQKMISKDQKALWKYLTTTGLSLWLGDVKKFELKQGFKFETADGTTGEIRTVKPGERIRLKWKPKDWDSPSTLQVSLYCPRNATDKTNLRFHQEKLKNAKMRTLMKKHWQAVLEHIEEQK